MFDLAELQLIRQSLDVITINGKDAKYVSSVQVKVEQIMEQLSLPEKPQGAKTK